VKRLLRHERPTRVTERFLRHLASDSLGRGMLDDDEREVKRVALGEN